MVIYYRLLYFAGMAQQLLPIPPSHLLLKHFLKGNHKEGSRLSSQCTEEVAIRTHDAPWAGEPALPSINWGLRTFQRPGRI